MSKGKCLCKSRGRDSAAPDGYMECPLVFISAPWNDETEQYPSWVKDACRMAMEEGYLPIAPYGMYSSMVCAMPRRGYYVSILVQALLSACREFWIFEDKRGMLSENQAQELVKAMEFDKPIRHFSMKAGVSE